MSTVNVASHKYGPKLPRIADVCQDIRDGRTTAQLAAMYDTGEAWIRTRISDAGYDPDTGLACETPRPPQPPSRKVGRGSIFQDQPWAEDALCRQTDPEAFFPEKGGSTREAKQVCASCTVREQCLAWAMDGDERFGIFGGTSERERRKLKKQQQQLIQETPAVLAATGTDDTTSSSPQQVKPSYRHNPNYISSNSHVPLPDPNRPVKIEQGRNRKSSIDWDKIRADHDARLAAEGKPAQTVALRCRWCREPADDLVDDVCGLCRHDAENQFTAPTLVPDVEPASLEEELEVLETEDPDVAAAAASYDDMADRVTHPENHIQTPPDEVEETEADPAPLDVVEHCAQLLRDTTHSRDVLVQVLRNNALAALAALDLVVHPEISAATPPAPTAPAIATPAPAPHFEVFKKPRRRRSTSTFPLDQAKALYLDDELSCAQIAERLGSTTSTVRKKLKHANVPMRDDRARNSGGRNQIKAYPDELVAAIRTRYLDHGMTQAQVAADLEITTKVVQNVMTRHEIPTRPSASASSQAGHGRVIKLDQATVDDIVRRYQAGESGNSLAKAYQVSLPSILNRLRQRGVPIRPRGGSRHTTSQEATA